MSIEAWNTSFVVGENEQGDKPNSYFKTKLDQLYPGKILLPLEGDGKNAIYAAQQGWNVTAFDLNGDVKNANKLSNEKQVKINYSISNYEENISEGEKYDCIALLYTHMPTNERISYFKKMIKHLKPNGIIILEGFNREQTKLSSLGICKESLFSTEELREEFDIFRRLDISKAKTDLNHSNGSTFKGSIVRMFCRK